jgi:hypothetical protein
MTVDEYWAVVRRLGLRPTNVRTVFRSPSGDVYNVPNPGPYTQEQREEIIERLKATMGISPESDHPE